MHKHCFLLFFTCIFFSVITRAQSKKTDFGVIERSNQFSSVTYYNHTLGNNASLMPSKQKNVLSRYNPVQLSFTGLMLLYQNIISPQLGSGCQFELTCSNFSKQAIKEFGLIKGIFISADRLLRCNPESIAKLPLIYFNDNGKIVETPKDFRWRR